jgi:type VI secretion system protein ImpA
MENLFPGSWLEPLEAASACGDDLEYDPTYMELAQAAAGKPETQFAPAEAPQWPVTRDLSAEIFSRTRDLRVAMMWGRAQVTLEGLPALPSALNLIAGLMDNFWDEVHPRNDPDDGDTFARQSVVGNIDKLDGLLGDVRQALVTPDRRLGGLRMREIEIAMEKLSPRPDESARTASQIQIMLTEMPDAANTLRDLHNDCSEALKNLQRVMNDRLGIENAADVKPLKSMLDCMKGVIPVLAESTPEAGESQDSLPPVPRRASNGGPGSIESRADAIKAINLICAYLERSEPTNPAQLLLRRAERLIEKDFLQLIKDLAPDAMTEVARIMGVDPDSLNGDSGSY